jgi:[protein-PII] uridylyltransferase
LEIGTVQTVLKDSMLQPEQPRRPVNDLSDPSIDAFAASLPQSYRKNFDRIAIAAHVRVSESRGGELVGVGTFPSTRPGTALCVIADDRPGLLATISAALVLARLDVTEAEAYTRRQPGRADEAVDVFWVRHDPPELRGKPVTTETVEALRQTLIGLLEGTLDRARVGDSSQRVPATPAASETVVRFLEARDGSFATLEVETGDRSGLLLALAQALFQQRVQIVSSQVRTTGTRVFDRFSIVELDGSPISASRRLEIQVAVLSAVDPIVGHRPSVSPV